ncbi:MAG: hypothetical protein R2795_02250 [Saprospiraceae bacterium]
MWLSLTLWGVVMAAPTSSDFSLLSDTLSFSSIEETLTEKTLFAEGNEVEETEETQEETSDQKRNTVGLGGWQGLLFVPHLGQQLRPIVPLKQAVPPLLRKYILFHALRLDC